MYGPINFHTRGSLGPEDYQHYFILAFNSTELQSGEKGVLGPCNLCDAWTKDAWHLYYIQVTRV